MCKHDWYERLETTLIFYCGKCGKSFSSEKLKDDCSLKIEIDPEKVFIDIKIENILEKYDKKFKNSQFINHVRIKKFIEKEFKNLVKNIEE